MNLRKAVKNNCCWRFINTKPGKFIKFFFLFTLDLVDLGVDWYFYAKLTMAEPGLVYGPPSDMLKLTTLVFCFVSTFCSIIETVQNLDDFSAKKKFPFLSQSLSTFIVTVFEDIPLLVLNLIFVICRDGTPSTASLIKATVCIGIVVIRFFIMILFYWFFDAKKTRLNFVLDTISSIGLFAIAAMSVSIQLLKTFPPTQRGLLLMNADPVAFDKMAFVREKYLNNVSIFAEWPIDQRNASTYIWLADINEVIDYSEIEIQIETNYNTSLTTRSDYTLCFRKKRVNCDKNCKQTTCYQVDGSSVAKLVNSTSDDFDSNLPMKHGYEITLTKEPAQLYKYLAGYIDYSIHKYQASTNGSGLFSCNQLKFDSILYAKFSTNQNAATFLRDNSGAGYSYYDLDADLTIVNKIWKTGIFKCPMAGDAGPKFNEKMRPSLITC